MSVIDLRDARQKRDGQKPSSAAEQGADKRGLRSFIARAIGCTPESATGVVLSRQRARLSVWANETTDALSVNDTIALLEERIATLRNA